MQLTIKGASNRVFTVEVSDDGTVADLKKAIQDSQKDLTGVRLIYSGRLLADDKTIASYGIASGHSVHMVVARVVDGRAPPPSGASAPNLSAQPPSAPPPAPSTDPLPPPPPPNPFGGFDLGAMLQNPEMAQMMQQVLANPQMLGQMMQQNPLFANFPGMEGLQHGFNPQAGFPGVDLAAIANNPLFQQVMDQMAENPQALQQMMQMHPMFRQLGSPEQLAAAIRQFRAMGQAGHGAAPGGYTVPPTGGYTVPPPPPQPAAPPPPTGPVDPALLGILFGGTAPDSAISQIAYNPEIRRGLAQVVQGLQICRANGMQAFTHVPDIDRLLVQAAGVLGITASGIPPVGATPGAAMPQGPIQMTPEQRFGRQLQQMEELGFGDRQRNVEALIATAGNVDNAINWLLDH